jgi:hypothetical protein
MNEPNAAMSSGWAVEPIREIESLWESGQNPDPDRLLKVAGLLPAEVARVLGTDQWQRWHTGDRLPVEDYFARHPAVGADPEAALVLVYGEFLVREELGEKLSAREYLLRPFPQVRDDRPIRDLRKERAERSVARRGSRHGRGVESI